MIEMCLVKSALQSKLTADAAQHASVILHWRSQYTSLSFSHAQTQPA